MHKPSGIDEGKRQSPVPVGEGILCVCSYSPYASVLLFGGFFKPGQVVI